MNDLKRLIGEPENTALEGDLRRSWYYSYIAKAQGMIHDQIPDRDFSTVKVASPYDLREEYFMGVSYNRVVMYLMSNACEWALKKTHGCTMCGHFAKQIGKDTTISPEEHIQQFDEEFLKIDFESAPLLNKLLSKLGRETMERTPPVLGSKATPTAFLLPTIYFHLHLPMFKIISHDKVLRLTPQTLREWFCKEMALLGVVDRDVNGFFDVHTHLAFESNK